MPAYMIFIRETPVQDEAALAEYRRMTRAIVGEFPVKPLAIRDGIEGLEGTTPAGVVMLELPSVEDARAWYQSPGYQAALPLRLRSAEYRAFIVEGLG